MAKQIRIGVIGVSGRGAIAQNWHNPKGMSRVVAGADTNTKFLKDFKTKFGSRVFTSTNYRKLLERRDIDAVAVASPDFCHEKHAIAVLESGKHVFCEKPLAVTVKGCDRILRTWKKSGKHLMVGFNMRYMKIFRTMKKIVDSGAIGEIKAVWVRHFVGHGGRWYYHDWHADRKNTTGLLLQKASHDFDMVHWISGHYTKRVAAFGGLDFYGGNKPNNLECPNCSEKNKCKEYQEWPHHQYCVFRKEVNVEDNNVVIMELDNGIKATYTQCHFAPDYFRNYTFIGTEGRVENLDDDSRIIVLTRDKRKKRSKLTKRTYYIKRTKGGHGGADSVICRDFIDMIISGKEPVATPIAGRMSVAVGCAATESLRSGGKVVKIKPFFS